MQPIPLTSHQCLVNLFSASVPAGFPSPAADHAQQRIDLNAHLIQNPNATYLFRVRGQSMRDIGIFDGDTLVVDRAIEPKHNHIVLAVLDDEFTVKRLHRQKSDVRLLSENPDFPPIVLNEGQELVVWGVVTFNLHKLLNN